MAATMKLFDAHCHLQDPRIFHKVSKLIETSIDAGIVRFAVNGVSEVSRCLVSLSLFFTQLASFVYLDTLILCNL